DDPVVRGFVEHARSNSCSKNPRPCNREPSDRYATQRALSVGRTTLLMEKNMTRTTVKTISFAALALFLLSTIVVGQNGASSGSEVLTNDKVITMVKAGLPPSII